MIQADTSGPVFDLVTYVTAFASVAALGAAKKYTGLADTAIGKVIKPVQPLIVLALSMILPRVIHGGDIPDATLLAASPTATLLGVVTREIFRKIVPARPALK